MDLSDLFGSSDAQSNITLVQVLSASFLSFLLTLVIGYTYRITHQGPSYSQTTVHTMVIMAVVVSLIMMIIGTNVARAFSLVGALSIIRFRNAVKESRDVAFYFLALAVGMACGTHFPLEAVVFTLCVCAMIYCLARFNVGAKSVVEVLLRMTLGDKVDYKGAFDPVFYKYLQQSDLLSVESDGSGQLELVYSVTLRRGATEQAMLADLRQVDPSIRAQLIHGHSNVNL